MSARKEQILLESIRIIAEEGYSSLSMRAVARASGLTLGALQYHFPTWEDLLRSLADHIGDKYWTAHSETTRDSEAPTLLATVQFILDDAPGTEIESERLFPQLWAMAQVEPVMKELLGNIYDHYTGILEEALTAEGIGEPQIYALGLMTLLESTSLFIELHPTSSETKKTERECVMAFVNSILSSSQVNEGRA
jgi:AcrR family transcriptional regulator